MKNDSYQLELFSDEQGGHAMGAEGKNSSEAKNSVFFKKIREFQKIIYSIIWTIFVAIIFFSLGMESGKKTFNLAYSSPIKIAALETKVPEKIIATRTESGKKTELFKAVSPIQPKITTQDVIGKEEYTIQVASILKSSNAVGEIKKLKSKGLSAFSAVKGKYTVIYVGTFKAKADAQSYLQKIKPNYPGCQIRRL